MKLAPSGRRILSVLAVGSLVGSTADAQTFFGEDLNGSPSTRLGSFPNAADARASFLGGLTGVGTESFEGFAAGSGGPLTLTFPGAGTAALSGDVEVRSLPTGSSVGRYPTDGDNFLQARFGPSAFENFQINFSSPVAAFGFMGTDIGDFGSQLMLTFIRTGGVNTVVNVPHSLGMGTSSPADGAALFFGVINSTNPFDAVEFSAAFVGATNDVFGFDQMTIGSVDQVLPDQTVVPEPATVVTLATGLAVIAWRTRRKQSRA